MPCENEVELMPVLLPGVPPRHFLLRLSIKVGVGDAETVVTAELKMMLSILIYPANTELAWEQWPTAVIGTNPGIELSKNEEWLLLKYSADSCKRYIIIKLILYFRGGCQYRSISTDETDQSCHCLKSQPEYSFGSLCGWHNMVKEYIPHSKTNAMLSRLILQLSMPE